MDELVAVLESILSELQEMNSKLDEIKGFGSCCSIADACDKLDEIDIDITSLETTITLGSNY